MIEGRPTREQKGRAARARHNFPKLKSPGVWELKLSRPLAHLPRGTLDVSVKDRQGNLSHIERAFSVLASPKR